MAGRRNRDAPLGRAVQGEFPIYDLPGHEARCDGILRLHVILYDRSRMVFRIIGRCRCEAKQMKYKTEFPSFTEAEAELRRREDSGIVTRLAG